MYMWGRCGVPAGGSNLGAVVGRQDHNRGEVRLARINSVGLTAPWSSRRTREIFSYDEEDRALLRPLCH